MGLTSVMLQGIGILLDGLFGTGTGSTISMRVFSAHCSHENITYKSCFSTDYVFFLTLTEAVLLFQRECWTSWDY